MALLRRLADNQRPGSLSSRCRRKRFALFLDMLARVEGPLHILDLGGTEGFWRAMGIGEDSELTVTLLNLRAVPVTLANFKSVAGDARDLADYPDGSVDIVFSNSTIEHLGSLQQEKRMADEIRRVARRYFIQTPSRHFPLEPHFLFPFFVFLPLRLKILVATWWKPGWCCRFRQPLAARETVESIRLLTRREFQQLFPEATLYVERFGGLAKSFVLYSGWESTSCG